MNPNVEVYVATHKPIDFALPDYCKKIQVNAEANGQWPGYLHDNDGSDNISLKNPNYCELTALYSMWKNCKADIQGLYHYRRFLADRNCFTSVVPDGVVKAALDRKTIMKALENNDIIISSPVYYEMPGSNLRNHKGISTGEALREPCYWKDIRELYRVIEEKYPDYLSSLEYTFSQNHYSPCNVFISSRKFVDEYCTWLFDVLGEVEKRTSLEGYDTQHKRIYGYMAEHLLNVYVHKHNPRVKYMFIATVVPESFSNSIRITLNKIPQMLRRVPLVVKIVRTLRGLRNNDTEENRETEKFYISILRHQKASGTNYLITEFTPKNPNNFIHDLESALPEFESQAKNEGKIFAPRVILSSETPESVRKSLFDLGVRVIHR